MFCCLVHCILSEKFVCCFIFSFVLLSPFIVYSLHFALVRLEIRNFYVHSQNYREQFLPSCRIVCIFIFAIQRQQKLTVFSIFIFYSENISRFLGVLICVNSVVLTKCVMCCIFLQEYHTFVMVCCVIAYRQQVKMCIR